MSNGNWIIINGNLQGDISYSLRKVLTSFVYVDFELITFSEKWSEVDIAFEYRLNNKEEWKSNAVITQTSAKYLNGNKLLGLSSSKYGTANTFQWKYSENNLFFSNNIQIRLRVLPRIRVFGTSGTNYQISSVYGDSLINFDGQSENKCIGINKSGQYMCVSDSSFYILDSLDSTTSIYSFGGVVGVNYAIQINSGNYIISDYGNNRIIEMDPTLSTIINTYNLSGVVFFDYSEANETLLITSESLNIIIEVTWSSLDFGNKIWQSSCSLSSPQCATYKQNDVTRIIISDTNNNRIIKCDRTNSIYEYLYYYDINNGSTEHEVSSFNYPYRVYQYSQGNICIIERQGRIFDFDTLQSSSSSSSSSDDLIWLENSVELWTEDTGIPFLLE